MLDSHPMWTMNDHLGSWTRCSKLLASIFLSAALLLSGCGRSAEDLEVDRQEIEDFLRQYLPKLGEAYGTQNSQILAEMAVPKEVSRIELRTRELEERGQVYEPSFKEVTVESVSVWNYSNALVSTFEVWDVRSYTVGSHLLVNESLDQKNRVKYQLKREGDTWLVLYRELAETIDQ